MSFIQREIDKLEIILMATEMQSPRWKEIYAAKQALHWASDPNMVASPYAMLDDKRGDNSVNVEMAGAPSAAIG